MRLGPVLGVALVALAASLGNLIWDTINYTFPPDLKPDPSDNRRVGDQPTNLSWFVHITDLHISKFYAPERTTGFLRLTEDLLRFVHPVAVVVTGDLTDAKTVDYSGSRQYKEEWIDYYAAVDLARNRTVWLDIRGNHDNFDVPSLQAGNNFFKDLSSQGREGNLGSYLKIVRGNGLSLAFLALDATLKPVGPRRPFNFVGALDQQDLSHLRELSLTAEKEADATIWFGHYPSSTIVAPRPGPREVMAKGLVYLCGHLHNIHGLANTMVVRHRTGLREAELSDWKDNRMFRLMAVDHGTLSWRNVDASAGLSLPLIMVTWPPTGLRAADREPLHLLTTSSHIRLLVFSKSNNIRVRVGVDGEASILAEKKGSLFTVPWQPDLYAKGIHVIKVHVEEEGKEVTVEDHQFYIDGTSTDLPQLGQLVLLVDFVALFQFFFILLVCIAVVPLTYLRVQASSTSFVPKCFVVVADHPGLYWPLVLAPLYLTIGPWFIGEVLSDSLGAVFVWGSLVRGSYLPTATTWLYGTYHLFFIHLPLIFASALIIHSRLFPSVYPLFDLLCRHAPMLFLTIEEAYLVYSFHLAYGPWAVILGPFRTGYLFLTLALWRLASTAPQGEIMAGFQWKYGRTF